MATRRTFLLGAIVTLITPPCSVQAQQAPRVHRIGWLSLAPSATRNRGTYVETLRAHGFIEGRNLVVESRYTEGREDRITARAA